MMRVFAPTCLLLPAILLLLFPWWVVVIFFICTSLLALGTLLFDDAVDEPSTVASIGRPADLPIDDEPDIVITGPDHPLRAIGRVPRGDSR